MTETANISSMAERVAADIFTVFLWKEVGPRNESWECVLHDDHKIKKHPSDLVMQYDDPYSHQRVYINFDLKSYEKASINTGSLAGALRSLCKATECANVSGGWQDLYQARDKTATVAGALFIYNHDGEYDGTFRPRLATVAKENYQLRQGNRVYVFGPKDICQLNTIAVDIQVQHANGALKNLSGSYSFFYPDQHARKVTRDWGHPATVEMLLSSQVILLFKTTTSTTGAIAYYKGRGESIDEFLYLIDYLFHYQVLQRVDTVLVRLVDTGTQASQRCSTPAIHG